MEKSMNRWRRELEEVIKVSQDVDQYYTGWMTRHPLKYKKWLGIQGDQKCCAYSFRKE